MPNFNSSETPELNQFYLELKYENLFLCIVNIILGSYLIYVMTTQSKSLGVFKYYLLNQTISAQLFELLFLILHPVILCPYMAGFMGGFFRYIANSQTTSIFAAFGIILFVHTAIGVFMSLINRLFLMFGTNATKNLHNKKAFTGIILFHLITYSSIAFLIVSTMDNNVNIRKKIVLETNDTLRPYFNEPSLMYVSELGGLTRKVCVSFLIGFIILSLILLGCVVLFVLKVHQYKLNSDSVSKASVSLIVSSLVQAVLCVTFLFIPYGCLAFFWGFTVQGSANPMNVICVIMALHGTIDMCCTLYFVKPYWRYCQSLWMKVKPFAGGPVSSTLLFQQRKFDVSGSVL